MVKHVLKENVPPLSPTPHRNLLFNLRHNPVTHRQNGGKGVFGGGVKGCVGGKRGKDRFSYLYLKFHIFFYG